MKWFFTKIQVICQKRFKISRDDKEEKEIAKKGKKKYMKYFNSELVAEYIINKTLGINNKKNLIWQK